MRRFFKRKAHGRSSSRSSESSTNNSSAIIVQEGIIREALKDLPLGVKALHEPSNASVDILFIHGLTGDREKTWSTPQGSTWPATLLPSRLPTARILTFGYNACLGLKDQIVDHSTYLLSVLATYRGEDATNNRPIIFVCHNLGGLVCQDALVHARQRPEKHLQQIYECTRGILFLGTPFRAAGIARWGKVMAHMAHTSSGVKQTDSIITDHEALERVQDSFLVMVQSRDQEHLPPIEITCFLEGIPLPRIGLAVPREFATLAGCISILIDQNHLNMTKITDEEDMTFQSLVGELRRLVDSLAKSEVPGQFAGLNSPEVSERASKMFFDQNERGDYPNSLYPSSLTVRSTGVTLLGEEQHQHGSINGDSEEVLTKALRFTGKDSRVTEIESNEEESIGSNSRSQDNDSHSRFKLRVDGNNARHKGEVDIEYLVQRVVAGSGTVRQHLEHIKCAGLMRNGRRCFIPLSLRDRILVANLVQIINAMPDEVISLDLLQAYIPINLCSRYHRYQMFSRGIPLTFFAQQLQNKLRKVIILDRRFATIPSPLQGNDLQERFDKILHDLPEESGQGVALALKVLLGLSGKEVLSLRFIQDFVQFLGNQDMIRVIVGPDQGVLQLSALRLLPGVIKIEGDSRDPANCRIYYNHSQLHHLMTSSWWFQNTWPAIFTGAYQESHWELLCNEQLATFDRRKLTYADPTPSMSDEGYISHGPAMDIQERDLSPGSDSGFQELGSSSYATKHVDGRRGPDQVEQRNEEDLGLSSAYNSVVRSDEDIGSRKGYNRNPMILAAEKYLQARFAANEELTSLLRQVSTSLAEKYLEADIRELLKYHHLDLKKLASTNLEHAAANLLRSHWYRQRIAVALVDLVNGRNPETDDAEGERPDETSATEGSAYRLNQWLQDNPGFYALPPSAPPPAPAPAPHDKYDMTSDDPAHDGEAQEGLESSGNTGDELDNNHIEVFAADDYVRRMERFVFGGVPFRKLLERVRTYTINRDYTALRCTLMTLPNQNIDFNFNTDANWFEQLRSNFERHCTMKCNWWPLAPPSLPVRHDYCRVSWTCHCGSRNYEDIPGKDARKLEQLIRLRCLPLSRDHLCLSRKRLRRGWSHFWPSLVDAVSIALAAKWRIITSVPTRVQPHGQATTASSSTGIHSTTSNPVSVSAAISQQIPLTTRPRSASTSTPSVGSQQSMNTVAMPGGDHSLILLGVRVKKWTIRIKQIDVRGRRPMNDGDVISGLLDSYRSARGSLRLWLSVKQLETLHFRQFFKHRQNRVNAGCEGIPESNVDYEYRSGEQSPPNGRRPPIRPDEFRDYLTSCATPCFYWILPGHECNLPSQENGLLDHIPKKSFWTLDCAGIDEAWGLDSIYDLSIIRIFAYHLLILCGTFGFWIWWQVQHPDDLQTAAVPATVVLSLISVFWSTTGILNQASDRMI